MRMFTIKAGQSYIRANFTPTGLVQYEAKVLPTDVNYFLEQLRVDPLGHVGCGPQNSKTIGGEWAARGFYGFGQHEVLSTGDILKYRNEPIDLFPGNVVEVN